MFSADNLAAVQAHLVKSPYLSAGGHPGKEDSTVFLALKGKPDVKAFPNTYYWFMNLNSFMNDIIKRWGSDAPQPQAPAKPAVEDDDLFGDSPTPAPVQAAPKVAPKKKEKAIAKSVLIFDVKVYEQETNLDDLAKKVLDIKLDGLVWNNEPKKIDIAYGIQKLQFACIIEDDKVMTDDIFEKIEGWEEVQSTDMVSMQKN